jgi:glycosyltransferase involved in cell wall biosynthesis
VRECLDSLLAQTLADIEIICVNDGSTDDSPAIIREYVAKDSRVIAIDQENAGLSAARNAGMDRAQGSYLAFVDSDDFVDATFLERLSTLAEKADAQIAIADYYLYNDGDGSLGTYRDQAIYASLNGRVFSMATAPEMAQFIGVCDRIFQRSFVEEHGFRYLEGRIYEDVPFCVETELAAERIVLTAEHLYYYRRGVKESITGRESESQFHKRSFLAVQAYAQEVMRNAPVSREVWSYYAWYFLSYALIHQRSGRDLGFFKEFFNEVRAMAQRADLLSFGQKRFNPELSLYRFLLRRGWAVSCYVFLKSVNQIHRFAGVFIRR